MTPKNKKPKTPSHPPIDGYQNIYRWDLCRKIAQVYFHSRYNFDELYQTWQELEVKTPKK